MRVAVLGPVEVVDDGVLADAGPRKQRAILAALALHRPQAVGVDSLVELVWADAPPPAPLSSLHGYVAGLRRVLEPDRAARGRASVLVTVAPGYALRLADDDVDAARFAGVVGDVHRRLAGGDTLPAVPAGVDAGGLAGRLQEALALWRGEPYQELEDAPAAVAERARLAELRLLAVEDLALLRLDLGEQATVAAELTAVAGRHPLRERTWALLALALARAGRQADALEALRAVRRTLADELGVDPGPALRAAEQAVLHQTSSVVRAPSAEIPPPSVDPGVDFAVDFDDEAAAVAAASPSIVPAVTVAPPSSVPAVTVAPPSSVPAAAAVPPSAVPVAPPSSVPAAAAAPPSAVSAVTVASSSVVSAAAVAGDVGTSGVEAVARLERRDPGSWPLVGRDGQLSTLREMLAQAERGRTRFALVTGEPGVGKSRLVEELARHARDGGFTVLVGACSPDAGAPPFWPWSLTLAGLGEGNGNREGNGNGNREGNGNGNREGNGKGNSNRDGNGEGNGNGEPLSEVGLGGSVEAERFRISDGIARRLAAAAGRAPVLVVLDDLHWGDPSSLRLLGHLADRLADARIAIVGTRRARPAPGGLLADAGERLARRHAVRVDLAGLDVDGVGELVRAVTGEVMGGERVRALQERTDGNPFFLAELLREDEPGGIPPAISDVIARRVGRLPEVTRELLRTAAVVGRSFALGVLAAATASDVDGVLDALEPALDAGVVLGEDDGERFRFGHALVRDVVYADQPAARRVRRHAAVAAALEGGGADRVIEVARHWLAAGPSRAGVAWRAAELAAGEAHRRHGYEEAAGLLLDARAAQARDAAATAVERYELLMAHAAACRRIGDRPGQLGAIDRACAAAAELGDVERLARAAVGTPDGSVWTLREHGIVHEPIVAALRRCLRELPAGDGELRCRALLALGAELYYAGTPRERDALAGEGLAMARRLGDPALFAWAVAAAAVAIWTSANAERRLALIDEALTGGEAIDPALRAHLLTYRMIALMEAGRVPQLREAVAAARAEAERLRLPYPLVAINGLETPLRAMEGRAAEAEELLGESHALASRTSLPAQDFSFIAPIFVRLWEDRVGDFAPLLREVYASGPVFATGFYLLVLLHGGGRADDVAGVLDRPGYAVPDPHTWSASFDLSVAAHAAFVARRPRIAAEAYARLAPLAGHLASAGSGAVIGPVDMYLALAAAATGEQALANRHADDAVALLGRWELPAVAAWFARVRTFQA
ncbi:BTAD domain-containing putative transcriptional regulator [Dactylosporangium sp. CS-047395]|uniref:BTAD domain-containing putative transcriptional regulator n=1 Tax=Dactylosporangium sp. CS-047395 TaxID=3239936 RepID=UPI003D92D7EE